MPDTRESRDKKGHDEEKRQLEHELQEALKEEEKTRRLQKEHEEEQAETELTQDE